MSKVLFLVNHDVVIYNFRLELVEELLKNGHDVYISSPYGNRIDALTSIGAKYINTSIDRHGMNPFKDYKLIKQYKKIIKEITPDIVFTYTIKPNIYGAIAARKCNVKCVANITGLGTALENGGIKQLICVALYKQAFKKIQKVFFQNEENMNFFIERKIALGKHDLLPGSGVNLNRFTPIDYPKGDIINFLYSGRIMKEKGVDFFLESAKRFTEEYQNVKFHMCGFVENEYKGKLEEYQKKGIIIYHGMVNNMKDFYGMCNCLVFPSYYPEGISNVLLEASACARPLITTNRAGCRETVDDNVNGYLIPIKNQSALDNAILKFIELPLDAKEKMGLFGRKKVEKFFDRQIVVNKYMEELK